MRTDTLPSPQQVPAAGTALTPAPLTPASTAERMGQGWGQEGPRLLPWERSRGLG